MIKKHQRIIHRSYEVIWIIPRKFGLNIPNVFPQSGQY
ncbi:hypothetical protein L248_2846 [Schleiferilactobacillus shenzhenensis LY-73]|uniref:Uncharacterized protein n=1 Tax=Schleiferilactobacillus shenzhenensis LY-73 TaxID=1231336 RepID=U4TUR8_9LACO|nr:hypothetical protein L248_2846 [Schleiferilactobacillus shenzhenensis LY-73]